MRPRLLTTLALFLLTILCSVESSAQSAPSFPPLEQWKAAVFARDAATLKSLYSSSPAAQVNTTSGKIDGDADAAFWAGLKAKKLDLTVTQSGLLQPGIWLTAFQAQVVTAGSGRTIHLLVEQYWQEQAGIWRLVAAKRDVTRLEQPLSIDAKIYPAGVDAGEQIRSALTRAAKLHKHVLLVFGADWCYDCHVLEKAFHRPDIAAALTPNYEVVKVDIGQGDKNQDLMTQYQVPMQRGVPAIAVLDSSGKLLYSQKNGEFERARALGPEDLLAFLKKWGPQAR
jgi:thioredoxin 1